MPVKTIGIDLGTTYSAFGIFLNGHVELITDEGGKRTTPSLVSFDGEVRLIGSLAKQDDLDPVNTISNVKRLIGQKFDNPAVQMDILNWPHKVVCGKNNTPMLQVEYQKETKLFTPEQISAMILGHIKKRVEKYLGYTVKQAVITVPAYFNDSQRQATRDAGKIAEFTAIRILNEPTSAAIAYGFGKRDEGKKNILVYDLGGGTFDVTLLTVENGTFDVKATAGDVHLGGEDFNNKLVDYVANDIMERMKVDIRQNPRAFRKLRTACEKAKRNLSSDTNTTITLDVNREPYSKTINRYQFERTCAELFNRTVEIVKGAIDESGLNKNEIDEVVLVGGSTRILKIQSMLSEFFNGKQLSYGINQDEAVAIGATIYAEMYNKQGAESTRQLTLNDVIPLSLGIQTRGGVMKTLIRRNTTIPTSRTDVFNTTEDDQTSVEIGVYEGESNLTDENNLLGSFVLSGIGLGPREMPKIDVTFSVNDDGILEVTAVDKINGNQNGIKINKRKGRLSNRRIAEMIEEERVSKVREAAQKEITTARNVLENLLETVAQHVEDETIRRRIQPSVWKTIVEAHSNTADWFDREAASATMEELEEKYRHLKEQCRVLEIAVGEVF